MDSGFQVLDPAFLVSGTWFWIPMFSGIPDFLNWIQDSTSQNILAIGCSSARFPQQVFWVGLEKWKLQGRVHYSQSIKTNNTIKETHRCILETFSFYFQTYIASLTNKPHWLCHVNKPQELSAKVLSLNWGRFSGSQSIVFSPDGRHLCCGTKSETGRTYYLTLWDVETGRCHVWFAVVY